MTITKTIKISAENYKWICTYAGELQREIGEPVSLDRALTLLTKKTKLSDLAGAWIMSDKEADMFLRDLRKRWAAWKTTSVLTPTS